MLCDNRDSLQTFSMFYALFPRTLVHSFSTFFSSQLFFLADVLYYFPSRFCFSCLHDVLSFFILFSSSVSWCCRIYLFIFLNHMRLRWPLRWQSRCKMWHSVYHGKNNTRVMSLRTLFWTYSSFELTDKREEASWVIGSFLK